MMQPTGPGATMEEKTLTPKKVYVFLKWRRNDLNTTRGDGQSCKHCGYRIPLYIVKGRIYRDNRTDIEVDDVTVHSYHLSCYDKEVFGFIRHSTVLRMQKVRKKILREHSGI